MWTIIAEFKDGTAAYLRQRRKAGSTFDDLYTRSRRWAVKLHEWATEETVGRLHGVQADGHYWQDVAYFRTAKLKTRKASQQ